MRGVTSRATRKYPVRLVSTTARNPSTGTSQKPRGCVMNRGLTVRMPIPALFTSMSIPPSRAHAWSTAAATDDSSRTSSSMPTAPGSVAATAPARSPDRPVSATVAPAAARADAMASPSPLVPPVTSTFIATPFHESGAAEPRPPHRCTRRQDTPRTCAALASPRALSCAAWSNAALSGTRLPK